MGIDIKNARKKFRQDVMERDSFCCKMCGRSDVKLDAHHITDRKEIINGGYVKENGITLCDTEQGCHWKAEFYHMSENTEWIDGFHPDDMYSAIGSSKDKAVEKSKLLFSSC